MASNRGAGNSVSGDMASNRGAGNSGSGHSVSENRNREPLAIAVDVTDNIDTRLNIGAKPGGGQIKCPRNKTG
jgi:hypothetical protein